MKNTAVGDYSPVRISKTNYDSIPQVEVTGNRSQYKICTQLKYADTRSHVRVCTHHSVIQELNIVTAKIKAERN